MTYKSNTVDGNSKGPVKLMQRVKIAHSFLQSVSVCSTLSLKLACAGFLLQEARLLPPKNAMWRDFCPLKMQCGMGVV